MFVDLVGIGIGLHASHDLSRGRCGGLPTGGERMALLSNGDCVLDGGRREETHNRPHVIDPT